MEQFQNKHITKALNIPKERFRTWITAGYVEPTIQKATGRGFYNIFSRSDVYFIGLFIHLTMQGYGYKFAAQIVEGIKRTINKDDNYIFIRFDKAHNLFDYFKDYREEWNTVFLAHRSEVLAMDLKYGVFRRTVGEDGEDLADDLLEYEKENPFWTDVIHINFWRIKHDVDHALDNLVEE